MREVFKFRIYPNRSQTKELQQFFGNARFIYNKSLEFKQSKYQESQENISFNHLGSTFLHQLKSENDWLKLSPSQNLQSSVLHLKKAYQNFFKNLSGFPKFKNKFAKQSLAFPQGVSVDWKNNKIIFPKLKEISAVLHRKFIGNIKTVTLSKTKDDKYYASILIETETKPLSKKTLNNINQVVAFDLGLKNFLTDNLGNTIGNPRFLDKYLAQIKFYDKIKSRKKLGSNNRTRIQKKINQIYGRLNRSRENFLHQISSRIVDDNQVIVLEDIDVEGLLQKSWSSIARNIADLSWSKFISFVKYKAERRGKELVQIDRFEPSSKTCSCCKYVNNDLKLSDRKWQCPICFEKHDRDVNAAKNILEAGLKKTGQDNLMMMMDRKGSFELCEGLPLQ